MEIDIANDKRAREMLIMNNIVHQFTHMFESVYTNIRYVGITGL
jgi:hypothetical protein